MAEKIWSEDVNMSIHELEDKFAQIELENETESIDSIWHSWTFEVFVLLVHVYRCLALYSCCHSKFESK